MITVEVGGITYTGFTSVSLQNSIERATGFFNLNATQDLSLSQTFPIKVGERIVIYVDNTPRLTGYVDVVSVSYNAKSHTINISGRDKTSDLMDSTLGSGINFSSPITLQQVAEKVIASLGITDIKVISNVNIQPFNSSEIISAEVGQSAFDFIQQYARKRQVLCSTDGNGNLLFSQSSSAKIKTQLLNQRNGKFNNIKQGSTNINFINRFSKYIAHSQGNPSANLDDSDSQPLDVSGDITGFFGSATDSAIRKSRIFNFIAEDSSSLSDCTNRSIWQANWERTQSIKYSADVVGHSAILDSIVWQPNLLVNVVDEFCGVESQLLISNVSFQYSVSDGSITTLELVVRDAYTLQAEPPPKATSTKLNDNSEEFIGPAPQFIGPLPQ